jgi:hypothetical protein
MTMVEVGIPVTGMAPLAGVAVTTATVTTRVSCNLAELLGAGLALNGARGTSASMDKTDANRIIRFIIVCVSFPKQRIVSIPS